MKLLQLAQLLRSRPLRQAAAASAAAWPNLSLAPHLEGPKLNLAPHLEGSGLRRSVPTAGGMMNRWGVAAVWRLRLEMWVPIFLSTNL